jgi:hypothetical protein
MTALCVERGYRHVTPALLCERAGVGEEAVSDHAKLSLRDRRTL